MCSSKKYLPHKHCGLFSFNPLPLRIYNSHHGIDVFRTMQHHFIGINLNINCAGKSKIGDRPLNLPNTQAGNVDFALLKKRNTVNTLLGYKLQ